MLTTAANAVHQRAPMRAAKQGGGIERQTQPHRRVLQLMASNSSIVLHGVPGSGKRTVLQEVAKRSHSSSVIVASWPEMKTALSNRKIRTIIVPDGDAIPWGKVREWRSSRLPQFLIAVASPHAVEQAVEQVKETAGACETVKFSFPVEDHCKFSKELQALSKIRHKIQSGTWARSSVKAPLFEVNTRLSLQLAATRGLTPILHNQADLFRFRRLEQQERFVHHPFIAEYTEVIDDACSSRLDSFTTLLSCADPNAQHQLATAFNKEKWPHHARCVKMSGGDVAIRFQAGDTNPTEARRHILERLEAFPFWHESSWNVIGEPQPSAALGWEAFLHTQLLREHKARLVPGMRVWWNKASLLPTAHSCRESWIHAEVLDFVRHDPLHDARYQLLQRDVATMHQYEAATGIDRWPLVQVETSTGPQRFLVTPTANMSKSSSSEFTLNVLKLPIVASAALSLRDAEQMCLSAARLVADPTQFPTVHEFERLLRLCQTTSHCSLTLISPPPWGAILPHGK